jgi:hypothetical protein
MKTRTVIRDSFWSTYTEYTRRRGFTQNDYPAEILQAFVEYVDALARSGQITESLAQKVTL